MQRKHTFSLRVDGCIRHKTWLKKCASILNYCGCRRTMKSSRKLCMFPKHAHLPGDAARVCGVVCIKLQQGGLFITLTFVQHNKSDHTQKYCTLPCCSSPHRKETMLLSYERYDAHLRTSLLHIHIGAPHKSLK